jgi:serine/threonine protein kinase
MSEELPTSTSDLTVAGDRDPDAAMGQIGSYTLLRLLGEGGMGAVYLAEQKTPVEAVMRERQATCLPPKP